MLKEYVDFLNINPNTFYGIALPDTRYQANSIWTKAQRRSLLGALNRAAYAIEYILGYKLNPSYQVAEPILFTLGVIRTRYPYLISLGTEVKTDLPSADVLYDLYNTDPATILITTAVPETIHIYHPVTEEEITDFTYTSDGTTMTISIYRYALLVDDNNPITGWDYETMSNFLTEVDVKSIVTDDSKSTSATTVLKIIDAYAGLVQVDTYTAAEKLYINYLCGFPKDDPAIEAIIQLAHANMYVEPNSDPVVKMAWLWAKDIPKNMPPAQNACLLGQFAGAYVAWQYATQHKFYRSNSL